MMDSHAKIERVLKIILMLAGGRSYSMEELIERTSLTNRTLYRYFESFRNAGLIVDHEGGRYRIRKIEPRLRELSDLLHFSEEEAAILKEAIHAVDDNNELKVNLIRKLYALYDFDRVVETVVHRDRLPVVRNLITAIREEKQVVIRAYHSSHGNIIRDRLVEPFDFNTNYISLWAFDPESRTSKVFKTARIRSVEITDNLCQYKSLYKKLPTDVFRMSGEEHISIRLKLSLPAYNLLLEEYPLAEDFIKKLSDTAYIFDGWVTGFEGVGRFVMGLCGEVEVVAPKTFRVFLLKKAEGFINKEKR